MPVCIAAICEGGTRVVVATDRLRSEQRDAWMPQDTGYVRLKVFGKHTLFMSSCASEETEKVYARACDLSGREEGISVAAFAEDVKTAQEEIPIAERERVRSTVANPRTGDGPDDKPRPWFSQSEFVVIGMEAGQPRIYRINEAGKFAIEDRDFTVIGDGEPTSWQSLMMLHSRRSPFAQAVYHVYEAKKGGECYVQVGLDTDMAILDAHGIRLLGEPSIQLLEDIHNRQTRPWLLLSSWRRIDRDIARLSYHGATASSWSESRDEALQYPHGAEEVEDEALESWNPSLLMRPTADSSTSTRTLTLTSELAVPFYRIAGPYELTCGVTAEEAEYLDATHIPRAVGRARDVKRAVFDHFQCAVSYDGGHPAIREWVRLSYGALKYLLNPRTMDEVDLPYARDVVVQLSQWYHSQEELRRHYNVYFIPIVETLWGHIEQFRDDSGKHVWRRNVGGTGGYSPTIDS